MQAAGSQMARAWCGRFCGRLAHRSGGTDRHSGGEDLLRRDVEEECHETNGDAVEAVHNQKGATHHAKQHSVGPQPFYTLSCLFVAARGRRG
eukprot:scaffold9972_cov118-Isochrysis_galbana.AAC.9